MWTKRRDIATRTVPICEAPPTVVITASTTASQDGKEEHTIKINPTPVMTNALVHKTHFHAVTALGYTLLPNLTRDDARLLLQWVLPLHLAADLGEATIKTTVAQLTCDEASLDAFSQIEYFFVGTDAGQLFLLPLLPPHFLLDVAARYPRVFGNLMHDTQTTPPSMVAPSMPTGSRRLLHYHQYDEPITALDHMGTIVCSVSSDAHMAISSFHACPTGIASVRHPSPLRCVRLWEGQGFASPSRPGDTAMLRRWRQAVGAAEEAAIYVFTGDEAAVVRLWRVDVREREAILLHVFVCSRDCLGLHSSLAIMATEDYSPRMATRETMSSVHCLTLDGDRRVIAGCESGMFAWALDRLAWRDGLVGPHGTVRGMSCRHPLCWDEERGAPHAGSLISEEADPFQTQQRRQEEDVTGDDEEGAARQMGLIALLRSRAARLVCRHVWVREATFVRRHLFTITPRTTQPSPSPVLQQEQQQTRVRRGRWKARYDAQVANGAAIGVVSNDITLPPLRVPSKGAVEEILCQSEVLLTFDESELRNEVRLPLACIEPVVYPLCHTPFAGAACFAAVTLRADGRLVTSASDGRICVWTWRGDAETYVPLFFAGAERSHRGLGRQLCVLRAPDVFLCSAYDEAVVSEWHVYDVTDTPLLRCERRFAVTSADDTPLATTVTARKDEQAVGVSCAACFAPFGALFLVATFEHTIQTFSLVEVQGCEPPPQYLYNGVKTIRMPDDEVAKWIT